MSSSALETELDFYRRFEAADMPRAMRKLADAFGEDALLVSSRKTFNGVEVIGAPAAAYELVIREKEEAQHRSIQANQNHGAAVEAKDRRNPANGMRRRSLGKILPNSGGLEFLGERVDSVSLSGKTNDAEAYRQVKLESLYNEAEDPVDDSSARNSYGNPLEPALDLSSSNTEKFSEVFDWEDDSLEDLVNTKREREQPSQQTAEDLLIAVEASKQIGELKQEVEALKTELRKNMESIKGQGTPLSSPAMPREEIQPAIHSDKSTDNSIARELESFGLKAQIVQSILQEVDSMPQNDSEQDRVALALRVLREKLPIAQESLLTQEGIIAVTGGDHNEQLESLTKLALYLAANKGTDSVAIISVGNPSAKLQRIVQLTNIKMISSSETQLAENIKRCARYAYLLIDIDAASPSADPLHAINLLRSFKLGHREFLAIAADAEPNWARENLQLWRSESTRACLVNRIESPSADLSNIVGWIMLEELSVVAWLEDKLLPSSVQRWKRAELLAKLSEFASRGDEGTIPVVC